MLSTTNLPGSDFLKNHLNEWQIDTTNGLPLLHSPLLQEHSQLVHAFTTRLGGNTPEPYHSFNLGRTVVNRHQNAKSLREDAIDNQRTLCTAVGLEFESLCLPGQVHSKNVVSVETPGVLKEVDGAITTKAGLGLLLHFADCVPIVLFAPNQKVLAIVHAGWRGTASRIAVEAVNLMKGKFNCEPSAILAAIGPAIGSCCYPTGQDAAQLLRESLKLDDYDSPVKQTEFFVQKDSQICPDLKAINAFQLFCLGLKTIDISNLCTACRPDLFYSHRQSGGLTGRQGVIAGLKGET